MLRDNFVKYCCRIVSEGERIPAWYGIAWRRWNTYQSLCIVMPFNVIARCVRAIIIWVRIGSMEVPVNPRDAYLQGYGDGRRSVLGAISTPQRGGDMMEKERRP